MNYRWIGGILVILGCGGFGIRMAAAHRREEAALRELIGALDLMECELQYHLTPLPELCRQAAGECRGNLRRVLQQLSEELNAQIAPDVESCMLSALAQGWDLPAAVREQLLNLGRSMGRFDLEGQLKGLEAVRGICRQKLTELNENKEVRLRSYQTLGFCAGVALAILLI